MTDDLRPCPFCGGTDLKSGGDDKIVGTWCLTCQAHGPNHYGGYQWDDRADATRDATIERLREALETTRAIVCDGAEVGFLPLEGDWAERLFRNNGTITRALDAKP